jgi:hypothetical protein
MKRRTHLGQAPGRVWALLLLLTPLPTALGECDANALIVVFCTLLLFSGVDCQVEMVNLRFC